MFERHPQRWLAPYAEGLLPTARAAEIARHVFGCPRCRRALDQVRTGQQSLMALPAVSATGPSWSELARRLDSPPPRRGLPLWWTLAAATAMVVMVAALALRGPGVNRASAASSLEALALRHHRAGVLDLRTSDDRVLRRWMADQAPLALGIDVPPSGEQHRLMGAARLSDGAVALGYRLDAQPVTLVISGAGAGARHKEIVQHSNGGFDVASWTYLDRAYVLVSSAGAAACGLCHSPAALL